MTNPDDFTLLERWRAGDRSAGDQLVKRHYKEITLYFANAIGDQDRDELTQETFRNLCVAVPRFSFRSSFRSFLFGIARNVLNEHLRRRFRRGQPDSFNPSVHSIADCMELRPSRIISELVRREVMVQCLRELPVEIKQLLELYYWHNMTAQELGEMFDIPSATVRTRVFSARQTLTREMHKREPSLASLDVGRQLEALRRLLGYGPRHIDEEVA